MGKHLIELNVIHFSWTNEKYLLSNNLCCIYSCDLFLQCTKSEFCIDSLKQTVLTDLRKWIKLTLILFLLLIFKSLTLSKCLIKIKKIMYIALRYPSFFLFYILSYALSATAVPTAGPHPYPLSSLFSG